MSLPTIHLISGPGARARTRDLLARFEGLAGAGLAACLWLGPTRRNIEAVQRALAQSGGCFVAPHLYTFQDFVEEIIRVNDPAARPLSNVHRRLLGDELVAELHAAGRLPHFQRVIETRGFGAAVFALLAELKRNEIWPEELAEVVDRRFPDRCDVASKSRQCAALYQRYQELLIARHLYDVEGRFWHARDLWCEGKRNPFEHLRAAFVVGFADFTPVQCEIVGALGEAIEEVWVALPDDADDERAELFKQPRAALDRLSGLGLRIEPSEPALRAMVKPGSADDVPVPRGLVHLERQLFRPLRTVEQSADTDGLMCIEAPGIVGEVRLVAREIKQLLLGGVAADDILVTLREVPRHADLIRQTFEEYGVPVDIEGTEPLARSPAVAALLAALRLREEDWPFADTAALLRNSYFRPPWQEGADADFAAEAEGLLRLLGESRGRAAYLRAVDVWADRPPVNVDDEDFSRDRRTHELCKRWRNCLRRFFAAWDVLPSRATLADHLAALKLFARELGFAATAPENSRDRRALDKALAELSHWADLERALWGEDRLHDFRHFSRLLGTVAAESGLARTARGPGRVRVLSALLARSLELPYVFVMDLGEGRFPKLFSSEPFFDEVERKVFKQEGLDFLCAADHMPEEMLLFYQIVTGARRQLTLSYAAVDENGQTLLPGAFYTSALTCFRPGAVPVVRRRMLLEGYDRTPALSVAEYRVQIASRAGGERSFRSQDTGLVPDLCANLTSAARMARSRFSDSAFGRYDGVLQTPAVVARLADVVGERKVFSATSLEQYIACPFRFFLGEVLGLESLEEPREELEGAGRGLALHRALFRLHGHLKRTGVHAPGADLESLFVTEINRVVDEYAGRSGPALAVLWRLEGQRLQRTAERYPRQWAGFLAPWKAEGIAPVPHLFEVEFGGHSDPESAAAGPLVVAVDGVEVRLRGRIDRIDIAESEEGTGYWVIDYKSGRTGDYTGLQDLERLQLVVYALATERVILADEQTRPLGTAYWMVTHQGVKLAFPAGRGGATSWLRDPARWPALRSELERWLVDLVRNIREGSFPLKPRSETCTERCPYGQVCRIAQSRSIAKNWELSVPAIA